MDPERIKIVLWILGGIVAVVVLFYLFMAVTAALSTIGKFLWTRAVGLTMAVIGVAVIAFVFGFIAHSAVVMWGSAGTVAALIGFAFLSGEFYGT
jgi:hypothetical protein